MKRERERVVNCIDSDHVYHADDGEGIVYRAIGGVVDRVWGMMQQFGPRAADYEKSYEKYYLNPVMNGETLVDVLFTLSVDPDDLVEELVPLLRPAKHGAVLIRFISRKAVRCELTGAPGCMQVCCSLMSNYSKFRTCNQVVVPAAPVTFQFVKHALRTTADSFGAYAVGINDCRTFASRLVCHLYSKKISPTESEDPKEATTSPPPALEESKCLRAGSRGREGSQGFLLADEPVQAPVETECSAGSAKEYSCL